MAWPVALSGRDLVGIAQTGAKTFDPEQTLTHYDKKNVSTQYPFNSTLLIGLLWFKIAWSKPLV